MERSQLLLTGALSGLVSLLLHSVLWSIAELVRPQLRVSNPRYRQLDIPDVTLHLLAGTGLGFLFWLSWGLVALVDVSWSQRGLAFAALTWLTLSLPTAISMVRARDIDARAVALLSSRWATTCLITGLACAWAWRKAS